MHAIPTPQVSFGPFENNIHLSPFYVNSGVFLRRAFGSSRVFPSSEEEKVQIA